MALFCSVMLSSCSGCTAAEPPKPDKVMQSADMVLENTISADREYIYAKYTADYRWYESQVTLCDYLDAETCDGKIASIVNVFQFVSDTGDPQVIFSAYEVGKPHSTPAPITDFFLGDNAINDEPITLTFSQALERCKQANTILPHNRHCTLRKPLQPDGFTDHAQYIFGNYKRWVMVDAVTGDVFSGSDT